MDVHADPFYGNTGHDVTSYFRSALIEVLKTAGNSANDGFGSNFSGSAFYLAQPIIGELFTN